MLGVHSLDIVAAVAVHRNSCLVAVADTVGSLGRSHPAVEAGIPVGPVLVIRMREHRTDYSADTAGRIAVGLDCTDRKDPTCCGFLGVYCMGMQDNDVDARSSEEGYGGGV